MTVRLGLRSRIVLVGILVAIVAYNADAIVSFIGGHLPVSCSSRLLRGGPLCGPDPVISGLALLRVVVAIVALIALSLLAVWALWPLRELADVVSRVGPQNLGYRIQATGRSDERRRLSDRLDQMMDRIAAAYEAQRQFAANASHELRTPLAVQRTLIEVSMAAPLTPEQIELVTRQLLQTNERNEQLIEGLLVLSESDRGLVSRTRLRLDLIAGRVIEQHREMAAAAGVRVDASLLERTVSGEEVLLERLVTNLVRNAISYNHAGGYLRVEVAHHPALVVTNSGDRVPSEAVDGLFEPFRRLGGHRIHHDGGAGLGLTIVRSIAAAHDATIAATPGVDGGLRLAVDLADPGPAD
jgi:signal transduction histidine kinase